MDCSKFMARRTITLCAVFWRAVVKGSLYITTLGKFSIESPSNGGNSIISDQSSSSWRLWAFLQYLCVFHDRAVAQEEIFDLLWNDTDSANPVNTVKTLLRRSRLLLEELGFPDGKEVLRCRKGLYSWNPDLDIQTDTGEFDRLCDIFEHEPDSEKGLEAARKAMELYGGDFLPNAAGSPWALSPRTYYHSKYLRLCCEVANALWERKKVDEAIDVCRTATAVDPYDESCHLMMMRLLQATRSKQTAAQYYNDVSSLFMAQLGIPPSEELTALYHELTGSGEVPEMDLRTILGGLQDQERSGGTFFCDYSAFRDIYSLWARSALRSGQVVQLSLITLLDLDGGQLPQARRTAAMEELRKAITSCCRAGDVCSQLGGCQYVLLLPTASYENGSMVIRRILNAYQNTMMGMTTCAKCSSMSAFTPEQQKRSAAQTTIPCQWKPMRA